MNRTGTTRCGVGAAALLWAVVSLVACGDSQPAGKMEAGVEAGGQCIADDSPCGPADPVCIGDCRGRTCCSGLCAGELCTAANVQFGSACRDRCGGDPQGTWRLVGGCVPSACSGSGAISGGTLTIGPDSTSAIEIGYDFHCGGYINTGGGEAVQGVWSAEFETIGERPYCVDGDRLFIIYRDDHALSESVLELERQ